MVCFVAYNCESGIRHQLAENVSRSLPKFQLPWERNPVISGSRLQVMSPVPTLLWRLPSLTAALALGFNIPGWWYWVRNFRPTNNRKFDHVTSIIPLSGTLFVLHPSLHCQNGEMRHKHHANPGATLGCPAIAGQHKPVNNMRQLQGSKPEKKNLI